MKAVLFDLDGTLIDSAPQLVGALNQLRQQYNLPPIPFLEAVLLLPMVRQVCLKQVLIWIKMILLMMLVCKNF